MRAIDNKKNNWPGNTGFFVSEILASVAGVLCQLNINCLCLGI
jgi:hypothetical protein